MRVFRCNVCGRRGHSDVPAGARDVPDCECGSSLRFRAIVHLVSLGLFGESLALPDFPERPEITGLGMSDWSGYADGLAQKVSFTNTFLHTAPVFDVTADPGDHVGRYDFVVSSDVLEHVDPPVQVAFDHLGAVLRPGGFLVLTVPYTLEPDTREHYPELHEYSVVTLGDEPVLVNRVRSGRIEVFEHPVFHGGPGATLELRVFSGAAVLDHLARSGFHAEIVAEPVERFGIVWEDACSLPILARR